MNHTPERNLSASEAEVERQMNSISTASPPSDLLGQLQTDLDQAIDDRAWDSNTTAEAQPDGSNAEPAPSRWWHSNMMRAAAALAMVGAAGWYFTQAGMPEGPTDPITATTTVEAPEASRTTDAFAGFEASSRPSDPATGVRSKSTPEEARQVRERKNGLAATVQPIERSALSPQASQVGTDTGAGSKGEATLAATETSGISNHTTPAQQPEALTRQEQSYNRPLPRGRRADNDEQLRSMGYLSATPSEAEEGGASESDVVIQESLIVTSEAPLLDEKKLRQGAQITQKELEKIPTAREPWSDLDQTPGVSVDRVNVGGNESGQQAAFRSQGAATKSVARRAAPHPAAPATEPPAASVSEHEKIFAPVDDLLLEDGAADVERDRYSRFPRRPVAKFDAMFFRDYGISQFVSPRNDPQSTFGLEADTGSYTIVRNYLTRGVLPPAEAVRVEEFLNAFDYGDAAPRRGDFAITATGAITPYLNERIGGSAASESRRAWLRIGVKAREVASHQRKPTALTFLVDTSGSMAQENRIAIVRQSLRLLVDELKAGDTVAIVTYGSRAQVLLNHTADRNAIIRTIDRLQPQGSTNLQEGMAFAYRVAAQHLGYPDEQRRSFSDRPRRASTDVNHRVLLLSDGVANVGLTDAEDLLRSVAHWASRGIELTSVGVGMGNYNDELLERLADRGDGRYAYVDRMEEARRLFVENLTGTLQTVGADARIQVTFDPNVVRHYRLVGYENRDIPDAAFRRRTTDGGEIGAGHSVTALYELEIDARASRRSELGMVALVYRPEGSTELVEQRSRVRVSDVNGRYGQASPALRLAVLTARFAEILRVSPYVEGDMHDLFVSAQQLVADFPGNRRVVELTDLVGRARDLMLQR